MRYISPYLYDMDQSEIDTQLKQDFRYPLLNYGFVIVNVLDGLTVFSKAVRGKKISDFINERDDLKKIRNNILKIMGRHSKKHQTEDVLKLYEKMSPPTQKLFLIEAFDMGSFFKLTNERIELCQTIIDKLKPPLRKVFKNPEFLPLFQPISNVNQIIYLWAEVMQKSGDIHWQDIINVHAWFIDSLEGAHYLRELDYPTRKKEIGVGGNINVLKNGYKSFKYTYGVNTFLYRLNYFPFDAKRPYFLNPNADNSLTSDGQFPIKSVRFYEDRVKTIFKDDRKIKVRETIFEHNKSTTSSRDYKKNYKEKSKLLLSIE